MARYIAVIHKDEGSEYGISFPDFPGCVSAGATSLEAAANGRQALTFHIKGMLEDGEVIPEPTTAEAILVSGEYDDGKLVIVDVADVDQVVRINITIKKSVLAQVDVAAVALGKSRSEFLAEAGLEKAKPTEAILSNRIRTPRRMAPLGLNGELLEVATDRNKERIKRLIKANKDFINAERAKPRKDSGQIVLKERQNRELEATLSVIEERSSRRSNIGIKKL